MDQQVKNLIHLITTFSPVKIKGILSSHLRSTSPQSDQSARQTGYEKDSSATYSYKDDPLGILEIFSATLQTSQTFPTKSFYYQLSKTLTERHGSDDYSLSFLKNEQMGILLQVLNMVYRRFGKAANIDLFYADILSCTIDTKSIALLDSLVPYIESVITYCPSSYSQLLQYYFLKDSNLGFNIIVNNFESMLQLKSCVSSFATSKNFDNSCFSTTTSNVSSALQAQPSLTPDGMIPESTGIGLSEHYWPSLNNEHQPQQNSAYVYPNGSILQGKEIIYLFTCLECYYTNKTDILKTLYLLNTLLQRYDSYFFGFSRYKVFDHIINSVLELEQFDLKEQVYLLFYHLNLSEIKHETVGASLDDEIDRDIRLKGSLNKKHEISHGTRNILNIEAAKQEAYSNLSENVLEKLFLNDEVERDLDYVYMYKRTIHEFNPTRENLNEKENALKETLEALDSTLVFLIIFTPNNVRCMSATLLNDLLKIYHLILTKIVIIGHQIQKRSEQLLDEFTKRILNQIEQKLLIYYGVLQSLFPNSSLFFLKKKYFSTSEVYDESFYVGGASLPDMNQHPLSYASHLPPASNAPYSHTHSSMNSYGNISNLNDARAPTQQTIPRKSATNGYKPGQSSTSSPQPGQLSRRSSQDDLNGNGLLVNRPIASPYLPSLDHRRSEEATGHQKATSTRPPSSVHSRKSSSVMHPHLNNYGQPLSEPAGGGGGAGRMHESSIPPSADFWDQSALDVAYNYNRDQYSECTDLFCPSPMSLATEIDFSRSEDCMHMRKVLVEDPNFAIMQRITAEQRALGDGLNFHTFAEERHNQHDALDQYLRAKACQLVLDTKKYLEEEVITLFPVSINLLKYNRYTEFSFYRDQLSTQQHIAYSAMPSLRSETPSLSRQTTEPYTQVQQQQQQQQFMWKDTESLYGDPILNTSFPTSKVSNKLKTSINDLLIDCYIRVDFKMVLEETMTRLWTSSTDPISIKFIQDNSRFVPNYLFKKFSDSHNCDCALKAFVCQHTKAAYLKNSQEKTLQTKDFQTKAFEGKNDEATLRNDDGYVEGFGDKEREPTCNTNMADKSFGRPKKEDSKALQTEWKRTSNPIENEGSLMANDASLELFKSRSFPSFLAGPFHNMSMDRTKSREEPGGSCVSFHLSPQQGSKQESISRIERPSSFYVAESLNSPSQSVYFSPRKKQQPGFGSISSMQSARDLISNVQEDDCIFKDSMHAKDLAGEPSFFGRRAGGAIEDEQASISRKNLRNTASFQKRRTKNNTASFSEKHATAAGGIDAHRDGDEDDFNHNEISRYRTFSAHESARELYQGASPSSYVAPRLFSEKLFDTQKTHPSLLDKQSQAYYLLSQDHQLSMVQSTNLLRRKLQLQLYEQYHEYKKGLHSTTSLLHEKTSEIYFFKREMGILRSEVKQLTELLQERTTSYQHYEANIGSYNQQLLQQCQETQQALAMLQYKYSALITEYESLKETKADLLEKINSIYCQQKIEQSNQKQSTAKQDSKLRLLGIEINNLHKVIDGLKLENEEKDRDLQSLWAIKALYETMQPEYAALKRNVNAGANQKQVLDMLMMENQRLEQLLQQQEEGLNAQEQLRDESKRAYEGLLEGYISKMEGMTKKNYELEAKLLRLTAISDICRHVGMKGDLKNILNTKASRLDGSLDKPATTSSQEDITSLKIVEPSEFTESTEVNEVNESSELAGGVNEAPESSSGSEDEMSGELCGEINGLRDSHRIKTEAASLMGRKGLYGREDSVL